MGPVADIELPDKAQPNSPLTLRYDFSNHPSMPTFTDSMVPAVVAVSEGSTEPEILNSHWDPATRTLTAETEHLSGFFPISVDFGAIAREFTNGLNGYLGLASRKPQCVGQSLEIDATTFTLDPPSVPAAWPCLSSRGDTISIDLASNSPNGWIVHSTPVTTDMGVELAPDVGYAINQAAYHTIFSGVVGDGTVMLPGSTTHLRFGKASPPQQVVLRADPGVMLLNGMMIGFHTLFPNSVLLDIPGMVDCLKTTRPQGNTWGQPSTTAIGADINSLINCVTSVTHALSTKPKPGAAPIPAASIAAKSLGAVLSLGPGLASQLAASLRGFVGEFTGDNTQTIVVRATTTATDAATSTAGGAATLNLTTGITSNGAGLELAPNHFQISKRYHHRNGYYADVNYKWTINRPDGSDLGYCKGHVTVTDSSGTVIAHFDDDNFNACYGGGAFSTNLELYNPGTYTVTADIEMERGPALHGVQQFVLDR
ncbi:hypothetical protein [Mycobacterium sp. JS623]|uniref:hypothetical protein n=1 Tax=Mycobacterium sp. JS623 TaxID=212767 RepID=UPI0002F6FCC8|nr:hypothetical protein [Mycobacterium sp. JS623]